MLLVHWNDGKAGPVPPCSSILTTSSCVSCFFTTSSLHFFQCGYPQCPVKPLSHLCLSATGPQNCPWSARALLARLPLPWWKGHDVYGSFLLDTFQIPPFFFFSSSLFRFFFSFCLSLCGWWGEWSWSGGWGVGGGWGEASSWAGMTRLVRCMRVFFCVRCYSSSEILLIPHI